MRRFLGSPNGRLFGVINEHEITFYRHDIQLWTRDIDVPDYTILGLGNQGNMIVLSPQGLYIWPHDPQEEPSLLEHFSETSLAQINKRLGHVQLGTQGTAVCAELISSAAGEKAAFGRPKVSETDELHEFLFFDLTTGRQNMFHRLIIPPRLSDAKVWDLSRNFRWMAFASPTKGSRNALKISVLDLQDEYPRHDVFFDEPGFRSVAVNRDGTLCIDTFHQGVGRLHLFTRGEVATLVTPPSAYEVTYFGRTYMAINLTPIPHILFKTHADKLIAHVDMNPLKRLGMDWQLHFDEREDINLLTYRDGTFRIVHTAPNRIQTDAKRWNFLASSQKLLTVDGEVKNTIYHDGTPDEDVQRQEERRRKQKELSKNLVQSVNEVRQERKVEKAQTRAELERQLATLRMQFATGEIPVREFEQQRKALEAQLEALPSAAVVDARKAAPRPNRLKLPGQSEGDSIREE